MVGALTDFLNNQKERIYFARIVETLSDPMVKATMSISDNDKDFFVRRCVVLVKEKDVYYLLYSFNIWEKKLMRKVDKEQIEFIKPAKDYYLDESHFFVDYEKSNYQIYLHEDDWYADTSIELRGFHRFLKDSSDNLMKEAGF